MQTLNFLGVYLAALQDFSKDYNASNMKREYWYVWLIPDEQRYVIKAVDQRKNIEPIFVTPMQFGLNFTEEKDLGIKEPEAPDTTNLKYYKPVESPQKEFTKKETIENKKENIEDLFIKSLIHEDEETVFTISGKKDKHDEDEDDILTGVLVKNALNQPTSDNTNKNIDPEFGVDFDNDFDVAFTSHTPETSGHIDDSEIFLLPKTELPDNAEDLRAMQVEEEIRLDFSEGLSLWQQGKKSLALEKFKIVLDRSDNIVEAHKHALTECTIALRKLKQTDTALAFALRCNTLSPNDSHTFFNVARIYYELQRYEDAQPYIQKALKLDPTLSPAQKLNKTLNNILKNH